MEYKAQIFEAKAVPEGKNLYIEAYAVGIGNRDTYDDVALPGCTVKSITGPGASRIKLCAQHKQTDVIDVVGKVLEMREDAKGLWFRAKISNTSKGKDIAELIIDGAIDEISIGYIVIDFYMQDGIRYLKEIDIREISIVIRAANVEARIQSIEVKEEKEKEPEDPKEPDYENMPNDDLIRMRQKIQTEITKRTLKKI